MQSCYYTHCHLCGSTIIESTRDLLRKEVETHVNQEHTCAIVPDYASGAISHIMRVAEYHKGSNESEVSKASTATTEPPLGIEPESIWCETRMFDLIDCISRYRTAGFPVNDDWLIELERYLSDRCAPKYAGSKRGFGQPPVPFHDGDTPLEAK